jgi:uncharacterized protein (TIGR02266 family)
MEKIRILLAGSDGVFLEQVKTYLRNTGVELLSSRKQEETLGIMHQMAPDIVYLSAKIAGGGLECLRTIKQHENLKRTPVVMVCSNESEAFGEDCLEAGCECLLRKPLDRRDFLSSVLSFIQLEKRTNARFRTRVDVTYGADSPDSYSSHSVNIGIGGMFIETLHAFPVGTVLMIRFQLPSCGEDIECSAFVAWINHQDAPVKPSLPPGMGLEFFGLSPQKNALLTTFLHEEYISKLLTCSSSRELSTS